ncbi:MAG: ACP S-malonyltransferase [bacterium]|nr:ACP S-malonyltransferase [bacterium]
MSEKIAFLFSGQGTQYVGMGEWISDHQVVKEVFKKAHDATGIDIKKLCFEGPKEVLNETINTQPALVAVGLAMMAYLNEQGIVPHEAAGHSLGEITALAAVGALGLGQAVALAKERGRLMQKAGVTSPQTMAALIGLSLDEIAAICTETGAYVANINYATQIVISGTVVDVEKACREAKALQKAKGMKERVFPLNVSIAAHSPLMESVQEEYRDYVMGIQFENPHIPFVANYTGEYVRSAQQIPELLVNQLTGTVQWLKTIHTMTNNGVDTFYEVGPGKVLTGLIQNINPNVHVVTTNV